MKNKETLVKILGTVASVGGAVLMLVGDWVSKEEMHYEVRRQIEEEKK